MRFSLKVRERYGQLAPFVSIALRAPAGYRLRPMRLSALLDTGSPWTAITPMGDIMLNIPSKALKQASEFPIVRFANYKFNRYLMENVSISLVNEKKKAISFSTPSVSVLKPTTKINPNEFKDVPAILGCDFLIHNKLTLHCNLNKGVAYLEEE